MASLNKVQLIGRLGKDPEIRFSPKNPDEAIASFSLATGGEKFKDKITGAERQTETEWHNCTAFGNTAKVVQNYIKKGQQVFIEGNIKYEKYNDKNGVEKIATKIIVKQLVMLGSKNDNVEQQQVPPVPTQTNYSPQPQPHYNSWGVAEPQQDYNHVPF